MSRSVLPAPTQTAHEATTADLQVNVLALVHGAVLLQMLIVKTVSTAGRKALVAESKTRPNPTSRRSACRKLTNTAKQAPTVKTSVSANEKATLVNPVKRKTVVTVKVAGRKDDVISTVSTWVTKLAAFVCPLMKTIAKTAKLAKSKVDAS